MAAYSCKSYIASVQVSKRLWGEAMLSRTRNSYHDQIEALASWPSSAAHQWDMDDVGVVNAINEFSDRFLSHSGDPIQDIIDYILVNAGFTLGGLPTGLPSLSYGPNKILPPTGVIGGIGEGIAGYWLTNFFSKLFIVRPVGREKGCDGVIIDTHNGEYGLLEIKTTIEQIETAIERALSASADLLLECAGAQKLYITPGFALSIGVSITDPITVNCLELKLQ